MVALVEGQDEGVKHILVAEVPGVCSGWAGGEEGQHQDPAWGGREWQEHQGSGMPWTALHTLS